MGQIWLKDNEYIQFDNNFDTCIYRGSCYRSTLRNRYCPKITRNLFWCFMFILHSHCKELHAIQKDFFLLSIRSNFELKYVVLNFSMFQCWKGLALVWKHPDSVMAEFHPRLHAAAPAVPDIITPVPDKNGSTADALNCLPASRIVHHPCNLGN